MSTKNYAIEKKFGPTEKNGPWGPKIAIFAKNIKFWPKMAIFSGPKIFKSGSADRAHRVFYFEVSYALLAQWTWSGSPNM